MTPWVQRSRLVTDETFVTYDVWSGSKEFDVTPELALVDPLLADRARAQLMPPDDTLARLQYLTAISRMASLAQRIPESGRRRTPTTSSARGAGTTHRRSIIVGGGAAVSVLAMALLLGVRVILSGSPAEADTVVVQTPIVDSVPNALVAPKLTEGRALERNPPAAVSQRFAWAPASGASGYHVELFRGASKIFETDTRDPFVAVPATWKIGQRVHALAPGRYRWYVWPLISGRRSATAIVQARLEVPAS